jgi:glutamine amidotransferase
MGRYTILAMCRLLSYIGEPVSLSHLLFETDSSLVAQSYSPRMMNTFLNLAGFGMAVWDPRSVRAQEPLIYRTTTLPGFDRNLQSLASKVSPTCLIAHVRGVTHSDPESVSDANLHPFRFGDAPVVLAHNGHLREFARMRYDLLEHVRPELARRIRGNTDSEWIYALVLSKLDDPYGRPETDELADAAVSTLGLLRSIRSRYGIDTSSPVNLCLSTGETLVATRFSFDYGWYPDEDTLLETDLPYVSLWYTLGGEYLERNGSSAMTASREPRSLLIASEPLTLDTTAWLEVPEYSIVMAERRADGVLEVQTRELDV